MAGTQFTIQGGDFVITTEPEGTTLLNVSSGGMNMVNATGDFTIRDTAGGTVLIGASTGGVALNADGGIFTVKASSAGPNRVAVSARGMAIVTDVSGVFTVQVSAAANPLMGITSLGGIQFGTYTSGTSVAHNNVYISCTDSSGKVFFIAARTCVW